MKKRVVSLRLFLLVCCALLAGCSSEGTNNSTQEEHIAGETNQETINLRVAWWGGQERHDRTLEAIELFEEKYPHINIEPEFTGWDGYWEKLNTQAAGNNLPDVINMSDVKLNEFNSRGLLADLTPFIDERVINFDKVDEIYQNINSIDGKNLGVVLGTGANGLIMNQDLLDKHGVSLEPGYTYDDLRTAMQQIKDSEGENFYGFDFANAELEIFLIYARQHGEALFNHDGTGLGFQDKTLIDFFTFIQNMVKDGIAPSHDITMEYIEGGQSMVGEGSAALAMAASNQLIGVSQQTEDKLVLNVLPSLEKGVPGNWIRQTMSFSVYEHSKHKEEAAMFIDFITNDIEANEILMADRGVPISSEVREHLATIVDESVKETFDFLDLVVDFSREADPLPPAGESEVRGSFVRIVEQIKYDRITPEEAAHEFRKEAESILE
ncbi:ABC transporter substrate-binding protein [Halalkalibacter urbisdiaboli]|uniref:ABC transporter substrate-binding protein n=1 Tax=Halalkalibacter urbisdiaboli TaxID=1960589 RepID=UPI000B43AD4B|nr:sugar ABC transporter substrate-binding protein [Halalkalibacter urbisdiaboli]